MISVGSSDARKGLGLGFGVGGREMEETELEEGEACSYNNNDDYDASMDPDIALSYIDEKLQDVLGHFQKDFEGGVSAETLGAKFGGYGSFLPAYQRSPIWSHPKSPLKVQSYNTLRSPNNLLLEGARRNFTASSTANQLRLGPACASSTFVPASKTPSLNDLAKRETCLPSTRVEESAPLHEFVNKKSSNLPDQKSLKVRIKVGSDNLSAQKNAAIYSGLGLDVSPSSSLENGPSESEGMCHEYASFESPAKILMVMTSFHLPDEILLSPLADDLIHLVEKEKLLKDNKYMPISRFGLESSSIIGTGSDSRKNDRKGEKNGKSMERSNFSVELNSSNNRATCNGIDEIPNKEAEIDTMACEELVFRTLKLPLLSSSQPTVIETGKVTAKVSDVSREASQGVVKEKNFHDMPKDELLEPVFDKDTSWDENPKASSAGRVWEERKVNSQDDATLYPRKDGHCNREKTSDSAKSESNTSRGKKVLNMEILDSPKKKASQGASWHDQESTKLPVEKEHVSSRGKKKSKGIQSHKDLGTELPKESLRIVSSVSKIKKNTHADTYATKRESDEFRSQKNAGRAEDRYKEFFGDMVDSEEENLTSPLEMKDSEKVEKGNSAMNNVSKERSSGKKIGKVVNSEYPKAVLDVASRATNGSISDAAHTTAAPVLIEENWVMCDRCRKWRLLPHGINPDVLPEKWVCSMLDWLPGKNRCSTPEDETTAAVLAMYTVPVPDGQNTLHGNPGGGIFQPTVANIRDPGYKKKHGLKETIDATIKEAPTQVMNSMKKSMHESMRNGSLNGGNQSPLVSEPNFPQVNKSSDFPLERHKPKQKEKLKVVDRRSDGGDVKSLKMKSKRADQDCFRVSKKIKTESLRSTDEDYPAEQGGPMRRVGPISSNDLPSMSAEKDRSKYNDHPNDSRSDKKVRLQVCTEKKKEKVQALDDGLLDLGNSENRCVGKKRKLKESHDSQVSLGSLPGAGNNLLDGRDSVKEAFSENDYRKGKKARVSNSGGKDSSVSKGTSRSDKKGSHAKNQTRGKDLGSTLSQRSLDGVDSLKRDFGIVQTSVAATSSSSKVSGSHKTKASFHETKGSPVESVSSSPMRILNPDKLTLNRRKLAGKDESHNTGFFTTGSPRRSSDGDDDGGSERSGTGKKKKSFPVTQHGSVESFGINFQDKNVNHLTSSKAKTQSVPSPDVINHHFTNGSVHGLAQDSRYPSKPTTLDQCRDEERKNDYHYHGNESRSKKSGKSSSSRSKDKNRSSRSDSVDELQDRAPQCEVKLKDGRIKFQEKFGLKSDGNETKYADKKEFAGKLSNEINKRDSQSNVGHQGNSDARLDVNCVQDGMSNLKQGIPQDNSEKSSKRLVPDKSDKLEIVSETGKSLSLPPSTGAQVETLARCPQPVSGSNKANRAEILAVDMAQGDDASKMPKQTRKNDQNGSQRIHSRHPTTNGHRTRDPDAPSPSRKESSSQAATNAVKEAKDLKHLADRLKNSGSNLESTGLYFQAALKFLHGASLLESCSIESAKHGEMIQSLQMYSSTAKLCE
ncbi:LOW QUALITY PROTEIN: uncharacterized protein LOC110823074 [Carica papaya]|uniref:LOW QUALITY PROTEIN: uncharacterized protein LOC110823074 n=1 Tax=Carica papaya TaxID=3649 RepID=UPI000B8CD806|nr:LOW QUALITY PROTEIN: uncharacterized protein LOC110823074 [Carica papaya]